MIMWQKKEVQLIVMLIKRENSKFSRHANIGRDSLLLIPCVLAVSLLIDMSFFFN